MLDKKQKPIYLYTLNTSPAEVSLDLQINFTISNKAENEVWEHITIIY